MDADTERLIRYLVARMECVGCHRSYDFEDIRVLEERPIICVLLMTCQHCGTKGLLMAFTQKQAEDPVSGPSIIMVAHHVVLPRLPAAIGNGFTGVNGRGWPLRRSRLRL